jgi:hypothetical protein
LIAIVDTGATHSFISISYVERLNLVLTPLLRGMVMDTPADGSVTTSLVCAKCPVNFVNVDFELDLVCLPLVYMDVIFNMDWMLPFGVSINCLTKSITFSKLVDEGVHALYYSFLWVKPAFLAQTHLEISTINTSLPHSEFHVQNCGSSRGRLLWSFGREYIFSFIF